MEALKTLAFWFASMFRPNGIVVGFVKIRGRDRYAKVMRFGAIAMVPLIMGAAFEVLSAVLPAQAAAGADSTTTLGVVPGAESSGGFQAMRASIFLPAGGAIAFNAANFVTITFGYVRGGAARVVFATYTSNAVNVAAEVETAAVINQANNALLPGDVVDVLMHQNGTGVAVPAGARAEVELG